MVTTTETVAKTKRCSFDEKIQEDAERIRDRWGRTERQRRAVIGKLRQAKLMRLLSRR